jgi:FixJ family two-component response regulator
MKEYALYKGDEILSIGTIREIAKDLNVLPSTVKYYGYNAYKRKIAKRKNTKNTRELIEIEDDLEGEI